jgi:hypothetical protein
MPLSFARYPKDWERAPWCRRRPAGWGRVAESSLWLGLVVVVLMVVVRLVGCCLVGHRARHRRQQHPVPHFAVEGSHAGTGPSSSWRSGGTYDNM